MPCMKAKAKVEKASKDAGIPTTVIHVGNFAEFTLSTTSVSLTNVPGMYYAVTDFLLTKIIGQWVLICKIIYWSTLATLLAKESLCGALTFSPTRDSLYLKNPLWV